MTRGATYSPRTVRPSFVKLEVDGVRDAIQSGPRAKNGKIWAQFYVRDQGSVVDSVVVRTENNGTKQRLVVEFEGRTVFTHETEL